MPAKKEDKHQKWHQVGGGGRRGGVGQGEGREDGSFLGGRIRHSGASAFTFSPSWNVRVSVWLMPRAWVGDGLGGGLLAGVVLVVGVGG